MTCQELHQNSPCVGKPWQNVLLPLEKSSMDIRYETILVTLTIVNAITVLSLLQAHCLEWIILTHIYQHVPFKLQASCWQQLEIDSSS